MSEKLIELLKVLDFDTSRLRPGMFKIPDKKLFNVILAFLLNKIEALPEKEKILKSYSTLPLNMSAAQEAEYRAMIIELISKISAAYPEFPVKHLSQSYIKVPQGDKIIAFFTSLCKTVLYSISKSLGETYVEPTNLSDIQEFIRDHACKMDRKDLIEQLESMKKYRETISNQNKIEISNLKAEFFQLVKSSSLDQAVKNKLNNIDESQGALEELKQHTQMQIDSVQAKVVECKLMEQNLKTLNCNLMRLQELEVFSYAVKDVLKENRVSPVSNEVIDLESLLKYAVNKSEELKEAISFDLVMANYKEFSKLIDSLDSKCSNLSLKIQDAQEMYDKYKPLVDAQMEEMKIELAKSEDPMDKELLEYINEPPIKFNLGYTDDEIPMPDYVPPVPPDQLAQWIVGDRPSSVRKSAVKSFAGTPKLSKIFAKRLDMVEASTSNMPFKMNLQPLIGIGQNRRETIASPMAQRERAKIRHIDDKREPLKATKLAFPSSSSSPISEFKEVLSFGDESAISSAPDSLYRVTPSSETLMNLSDLAAGCGFTETEKSLNVSKDILLWNQSSSDDSDLELAVQLPVSANNDEEISAEISPNDSLSQQDNNEHNNTNELIQKFLDLKKSIAK